MMPLRVLPAALLSLLLAACIAPLGAVGPATVPAEQAAGATLVALLGTQQASQPTPLPSPTATVTSPPTPLPATATMPPPSPTPTAACTDLAKFVSDVTVPDGTLFGAGAIFTKTWRLRNAGSCPWTTNYALVFLSGNQMNAPSVIALGANVPPGATVDVSAKMAAPASSGQYQGNWALRDAGGVLFGTATGGRGYFWVRIKVGPPTKSATPLA